MLLITDNKFQKIGDTLNLFWHVKKNDEGKYYVGIEPVFIQQDYWNDVLVLRKIKFNKEGFKEVGEYQYHAGIEEDYLNLITPIYKRKNDYDWSNFIIPDFNHKNICIFVSIYTSDNEVYNLAHCEHDSSGCDHFEIDIDKENLFISYKRELIQKIRSNAENIIGIKENEWA